MYIQLGCSGALPQCTSRPHFARSMSHRSPQTMRRQHAVVHCKRAARDISELMHAHRTASAGSSSVAGFSACPATCGRRHKSHKLLCGARLATARRAAAEHEGLGRTWTLELACDAGTSGTLSARDLGRHRALAHLLLSCSSAALQRDH